MTHTTANTKIRTASDLDTNLSSEEFMAQIDQLLGNGDFVDTLDIPRIVVIARLSNASKS